ncbi:15006_t:CDS:2 [Funneliformis caledonium]|uniref:15006_t:CDS:1 n=1 Tax=Funneliformis caledonium TaxID=1117310 RepID=A0A9N8VPL6_9GLOM|nr:15006_t:CDS:2 [Funneliformis caledonium]
MGAYFQDYMSIFICNSQIKALGVLELAQHCRLFRLLMSLTNILIQIMNILKIANPAKCSEQDDESTKSDEGTIADSLMQNEDQRLSLKKYQSEIDFTQDEDQRLLLKKCQSKIDSTQDEIKNYH